MNRIKNNESGFSAVEIVMVVVIVGLIGAVGYLVYKNQHKTTKTVVVTKAVKGPSHSTANTNTTSNWISASSKEGQFSLKYPKNWITQTCNGALNRAISLGPDTGSVVKCNSDGPSGQVYISSTNKNTSSSAYDFSSGYKNLVTKTIVLNGVTGQRTSAVAYGQSQGGLGSFVDNTIIVEYKFIENGITYTAAYQQFPSGPSSGDELSVFDLMITSTLKFSS